MLQVSDPIKKQLIRSKFLLEFGLKPHLSRRSDADNVIAVILLDYCVESLLKTILSAAPASSDQTTAARELRAPAIWMPSGNPHPAVLACFLPT